MKDAEHKRIVKERQLEKHFHNPLDPLVLRLSKDYINDEDLTSRLAELFKVNGFDAMRTCKSKRYSYRPKGIGHGELLARGITRDKGAEGSAGVWHIQRQRAF